ncbi:MAG TPA: hypothetical protein VFR27_06660 [Mycobacterium sp.]|nr:hypothetical protein [Mycobacterium sp.]
MFVQKFCAGATLAGGTAVAVAVLGISTAHADNGTDEINGWTVTPTGGTDSTTALGIPVTLPAATLSDPTNSLGLGTAPIAGEFDSVPADLSSIGSNDLFTTSFPTIGSPSSLSIQDNWLPGIENVFVSVGNPTNNSLALLVPAIDGDQVVDLLNHSRGDAPPLFNPDAAGPIDIGGLPLADPQDGALLNDLFDAAFLGDPADWGKAGTLFDDWLGIDPSSATAAVDPNWLTDFGF